MIDFLQFWTVGIAWLQCRSTPPPLFQHDERPEEKVIQEILSARSSAQAVTAERPSKPKAYGQVACHPSPS